MDAGTIGMQAGGHSPQAKGNSGILIADAHSGRLALGQLMADGAMAIGAVANGLNGQCSSANEPMKH